MKKVIEINQLSDLPIDYVSLEPKDFTEYDYEVVGNQTYTLVADENGYIDKSLRETINLMEQNTVVINSGVGSGKSTTCINIALAYYNSLRATGEHHFTIIFAAPFKSLIKQYESKLLKAGISADKMFDYNTLSTESKNNGHFPIHLITTNSLLGNYGEDALMQSKVKNDYLNEIISYCSRNRRKVIIFFDEIHDSTNSFQQKFIYNLWKWQGLVHKTFVLSATFSQASKIIVKYIADLTNSKIHLLESKRYGIEVKQSNLHLIFNDKQEYDGDDEIICRLINDELDKGKKLHILTFSKSLAKEMAKGVYAKGTKIANTKISDLLKSKGENINLCTSATPNTFQEALLNIGTNFKTGIDITRDNSSFIIIMPDRGRYDSNFIGKLGIFTDGRNAIIQAIARVRNTSCDIFIVMPKPDYLIDTPKIQSNNSNYDYLSLLNNNPEFSEFDSNQLVSHYFCLDQEKLIDKFYKYHNNRLSLAYKKMRISGILDAQGNIIRGRKPKLHFPDFQEYIMEDGDRFLAKSYDIFGKNCSTFIFWAALNNQFENARLKTISLTPVIYIEQDKIIENLCIIYNSYIKKSDYEMDFVSEKKLYEICENMFLKTLRICVVKNNEASSIIPLKDVYKIKQLIISLVKILKRLTPNSEFYNKAINEKTGKLNDFYFSKQMYICSCIATVTSYLFQYQSSFTDKEKLLVEEYFSVYKHFLGFIKKAVFTNGKGVSIIPTKETIIRYNLFSKNYKINVLKSVRRINRDDAFINTEEYSFCQWIDEYRVNELEQNEESLNRAFGLLLDEFRNLFFQTAKTTVSQNSIFKNECNEEFSFNTKVYRITSIINLMDYDGINLLYNSDAPYMESSVSEEYLQKEYEYQKNTEPDIIL